MALRNAAHRNYVRRVVLAMTLYVVTLLLANYLIENGIRPWIGLIAAMVPALCVASVFWAIGRLIVEETDEYLRSLVVRQVLVATGVTLTIATLWGFLEDFDFLPHLPTWLVAPLFFFGLGIGAVTNRFGTGEGSAC
ncbi:MAG TPA: hypothetical protein VEA61_12730 [Allosphingosinicella sp.]|nr:hypothetical protein [Allosphingosinicella sp.]